MNIKNANRRIIEVSCHSGVDDGSFDQNPAILVDFRGFVRQHEPNKLKRTSFRSKSSQSATIVPRLRKRTPNGQKNGEIGYELRKNSTRLQPYSF